MLADTDDTSKVEGRVEAKALAVASPGISGSVLSQSAFHKSVWTIVIGGSVRNLLSIENPDADP